MKVGDLVFMHNVEDLGIIVDKKFKGMKGVDSTDTYQVKWFYTMADDFRGHRGPGNWYFEHHISSLNAYLAVR